MASVFADVPDWPSPADAALGRDMRHDNQPPLEDRVMLEFEEAIEADGIKARIQQLLDSAAKCPEQITDEATAGKVGDFIRLARDVEKRINDAREKHNRPLLNAQRSLKGKADAVLQPLITAGATLRTRLNAFIAEQQRKEAEERRRREEEARKAREAMEQAGVDEELVEAVTAAPPPPKAAPVRGDYGSTVSARTVWKHEIEVPIAKLPKAILDNEKVREAVDQVIRGMVRGGAREIKGVRIWEEKEASVR